MTQETEVSPASAPETSSAALAPDTGAAANTPTLSTDTADTAAAPDPTPSGDQPADMVEAVRRVLEPAPQTDTPPAAAPATDAVAPVASEGDPTGTDTSDEVTPDDLRDIQKPSVKRRLEKLLEQRNTYRREVETIRPDADAWRQTSEWLTQARIDPQGFNQALGLAALWATGRHADFLAAMRPYLETAQLNTGDLLTPDMQRQVDEGMMTPEAARELVRARAEASRARHEAELIAQQQQNYVQSQQQQAATHAVASAVTQWEQSIKARDPDYALKAQAVARHARALAAERGAPATPDAAIAMAKEAYAEVTRLLGVNRPAPAPTRPSPTSASTPTQASPQPRSMEEAVVAGLRRAHAA